MTGTKAPVEVPVALAIAGSDSGGGAGIQADTKTMEALGVFATTAITSVTAQHTRGVESTHVLPVEAVESQCAAVRSDFDVRAVKTGLLATAEIVETVAEHAREFDAPIVVDPVMVAGSGDRLLEPAGETAYEDLVREATLVTPNADEAAVLTGVEVEGTESARRAGEELVELGADAALVTGGHLDDERDSSDGRSDSEDSAGASARSDGQVRDVLVTGDRSETFTHPRIDTDATHGSGCTLSSAIAARLAHGDGVDEAIERATGFVARAVRYPLDVGEGPGSVHHLADLRERAAREETAEAVHDIVDELVARDASALVPEVGMNVVGATPYAERVSETAAVEGRITRTLSGIQPNRGVRFGASSHVARFVLAAREFDPDLRFAVNCRFDSEVEAALGALDGPIAEFDRAAEPESVKAAEGSTMQWGARRAFEASEGTPVAVIDRGEVGKEAIVKLVATDADTLIERVERVLDAV